MAQVKGTAVQASMRYVRERDGEAPLARVVDALSDADRTALGQGGSPEFIISRAARAFASYYDTGDLKVVESGPGRAVVELTGLEGGASQFCERIYGWMQRTLELAGAKNLRSAHSACVHRGDATCRFEGSWD
jgi:hypothetical protein